MAELLRKTICNHSKFLRFEIADALAKSGSLKAIEILAATSRHSQVALNSIELTAVPLERLAPQRSPTSSPKKAQLDEPSMNTLPSTGLEGWDPRASATSSDKMTNRLADRQLKFRQVVKEIIQQMLKVGTSSREARMLFRQAVRRHEAGSNGKEALDEDYLELILSGMQSSNCHSFIDFRPSKAAAKNGIIIPDRPKQEHDQDDNIHSMSYMQQIYTPIDPPSFDDKANDKITLTSGPTSSAFGLIFANGILNASTPNSKASHYFMDPVDTSEYGLSPPPMTPSSSRESTGGTTHNQVLELIGYVKLCSPRRLDDSIWTALGLIFLVRLIQLSSTERQLMMAL
ncbi:hypothetical protein Pst134EA_006704 [Puccinia striiformis f. sp. tritici]|uniref:hypothetical protein n=1 Tax=Puccinia striiformis f. sp. tritici TaxID=168172 RepID=UPI0020088D82|nr:hypothetical protein Pst134EA_006704 [Puccinia striiformis f. sp. tritici]KAH9469414.1 hypothetical protein Pst134EA_006704 [Puccinia striiformis f. sp. tritici]